MSMESLLASEPVHSVYRQAQPGEKDAGGLPVHGLVPDRSIVGRLKPNSSRQKEMWASLGVESDYTLISQDLSVKNGEYVKSADNRLFRVVSVGEISYGKGSIPTHTRYALQQEIQKDTTK